MALKQLKALRKKHKMTQKQLANAIGIDNSTFSGQIRTPRLVSVERDGFAVLFPK